MALNLGYDTARLMAGHDANGDPVILQVGADGEQVTAEAPYTMGAAGTQAVSTTILRVLGATNWTLATTNGAVDRWINVTNNSATLDLYLVYVAVGASLALTVSSTLYEHKVAPAASKALFVPAGYDLACVRASVSTDTAYARELLK